MRCGANPTSVVRVIPNLDTLSAVTHPKDRFHERKGTAPERWDISTPFEGLNLDDSAFQCDRDCVGSVASAQFGENILNMALHCFFRYLKIAGN